MKTYGVATIFGNSDVGTDFTADYLPLHLTHIDSFNTSIDIKVINEALVKGLSGNSVFAVTALRDEMYGPNKDIPVTVLELSSELVQLHDKIVSILEYHGVSFKSPHYLKHHFKPHISIYGNRRVNIGDSILIQDISIATKVGTEEDDIRRIIVTIPLQKF